jgi:neutral ceramidase
MKRFQCFSALALVAFSVFCSACVHAAESGLRVGVAEADITPPKGFPMAGYYYERQATGMHDPLKARAIVFRGEHQEAAWVACDLIGIAADLTAEVRRRVAAKTGIPAENIILTATHSHTAPDYARDLYQYLGAASNGDPQAGQPYAARLVDGIVRAVATAHASSEPATVEAGLTRQETPVSFNRRFVMHDGSVQTWMKLDNPGVVRSAGPIDPEVGLLLVRSTDRGQPRALLSNFALHLDTVGGTNWSADFPYYIEQAARQRLGREVVSIFGTGCCGDINHVDPSRKDWNKTDFIGRSLAKTVQGALPELRRVDQPRVRVGHATVTLPLQEVSADQVAQARSLLLEARSGKKAEFLDLVKAYKAVMLDQLRNKTPQANPADVINWGLCRTWAGVGNRLPVEVDLIGLGRDVAIVFLPGEVFVNLGLAVKQASPFRTTLVVELANSEETLYIPTRVAYAGGSYEVTNSALQPGSGEMLAEAACRLLRQIASEDSPPKHR